MCFLQSYRATNVNETIRLKWEMVLRLGKIKKGQTD